MTPADRSQRMPDPPATVADLAETFVLLDNSSGRGAPSLLFSEPIEIISAHEPHDITTALDRLIGGTRRGLYAAGFFAYELGYALEPRLRHLMPSPRQMPLMWFGLYAPPQQMSDPEVDQWLASHLRSGSYEFTDVRLAWDQTAYEAKFAAVQELIRAGDIYQLNLTFKAGFRLTGSPLTFYRDLRRRQRVVYGGIVDTGQSTVLSASPELFIARHGQVIETRPMKGTSPRAGGIDADAELRQVLATDVKQRAENLMIVDLMRNDLGRLAEIGAVSVTDLFTVETFRTLHQMTSGVRATLRAGVGLDDLLAAIFPPGSVTGAPKIRAMELIAGLETEPRGVYCGAIGYIAPSGDALFNVAIRTPVIHRDGRGEMGIGSGVVADSVGSKEYAECLLKMKFLTDPPKPFQLIETLLHAPEQGGYWLLDHHLGRLERSARYFNFAVDLAEVRGRLDEEVKLQRDARLRVRLLLSENGAITITTAQQPAQSANAVMRYVVSPTRLSSTDPFLFHKTTRRELYDREHQYYLDTAGADEVIYLNELGDLAEGSRTTIFVERDGVLLTPPLTAGLLPGTLRADLLATGRARETRLGLSDLSQPAVVYLGNSVRGLIRAEPIS